MKICQLISILTQGRPTAIFQGRANFRTESPIEKNGDRTVGFGGVLRRNRLSMAAVALSE